MAPVSQEVTQENVKVRVFLKGIDGTSRYVVYKITIIKLNTTTVIAAHLRYF